ncbi:MAG: sugar phosphate nucleotidyltransferase, partial [Pseudomonadota bacterium]
WLEVRGYKGIILAGGTGSRLWPATLVTSKQAMPVYDKPLIYYPLTTLMAAGLRDIAIITTPRDADQFRALLGDGAQWGVRLTYLVQAAPEGLAQAYLLAQDFLQGAGSVLILGDNIFDVPGLSQDVASAMTLGQGATVFGIPVPDPERFGVAHATPTGTVTHIVEKPFVATSNLAVTGLYVCDGRAPTMASWLSPSVRGELEIVDLLRLYMDAGLLRLSHLSKSVSAAWFDTGTHDSLFEAASYVRDQQTHGSRLIGSPTIEAYQHGWIDHAAVADEAAALGKSSYGLALEQVLTTGRITTKPREPAGAARIRAA